MSHQQLLETPWERIEYAAYIWSLDEQRDKLEAERRKAT